MPNNQISLYFFCLFIFTFSFAVVLVGCKRQVSINTILVSSETVQFGDARHHKEGFDRSLELLNSLDESPCLPNTAGYERLVSAADWLNRWIQSQRPDETWKPDTVFQDVERAAEAAAETAQKILTALSLIRGEPVMDAAGQPLTPSETLEKERQEIVEGLNLFAEQLKALATLADIPLINRFSQRIPALQNEFAALERLPNINAATTRAFTRQREREFELFIVSAEMFKAYAQQLKTDGLFITTLDIEYLKQSTWMRDIAQWAAGDKTILLEQAIQTCDWVVCNVEMRSEWIPINQQEAIEVVPQYPWQTILLGYGTAYDRMTVFLELLRQQRIDAALLSVPHPNNPKEPLYWGIGVLLDDQIYVFMLDYGMPFPGPDGVQIGEDGALQFTNVAALPQLIEDETLLRRLDISETQKFPLTSEMLKQTSATLFVTPESVSMRMKVLESELSGKQNMVLYTDAQELHRRFLAAPGIIGVEFWKYPLRTAFEQRFNPEPTNEALSMFLQPRPRLNLDSTSVRGHYPLWSGRILYFKGQIRGQDSAVTKYQNARISDREIIELRNDPAFRNNPAFEQNPQMAVEFQRQRQLELQWVSIQAGYWLGAALLESDSIPAAKDTLTGIHTHQLNPWRMSTEYLLGRIAEREGRYDDARRHYINTSSSMSGLGNRVRAGWLPGGENRINSDNESSNTMEIDNSETNGQDE